MLGTRQISGVAIDLWVGHPHLFRCDQLDTSEIDWSHFKAWLGDSTPVKVDGGQRHLAFVPAIDSNAKKVLSGLLQRFPNWKRITIILSSSKVYDDYLEALEEVFPEDHL